MDKGELLTIFSGEKEQPFHYPTGFHGSKFFTELQVSGKAGARQVPDAKTALVSGFGGCMWADVIILRSEMPR